MMKFFGSFFIFFVLLCIGFTNIRSVYADVPGSCPQTYMTGTYVCSASQPTCESVCGTPSTCAISSENISLNVAGKSIYKNNICSMGGCQDYSCRWESQTVTRISCFTCNPQSLCDTWHVFSYQGTYRTPVSNTCWTPSYQPQCTNARGQEYWDACGFNSLTSDPEPQPANNVISGKVVARENCTGADENLTGTTVYALHSNGTTKTSIADGGGNYSLSGIPSGSGTVTVDDPPIASTRLQAMFNGNVPWTRCSSTSVPYNFSSGNGSMNVDFVFGYTSPPTSTPIPTATPQFTPTPTDTPIPTPTSEWECPPGYNQQCVVSGGSCSEMRIARCGICGGLNDCCCTSSVPGGTCPNGTCGASESCSTCEADCGACPLPPTATLPPGAPTLPPGMRTITGKLFIDSGGTTAQQDVGESCYDQPVSVRIEDVSNPALVYTSTAAVVAGCATYTQQVQDGHTYRITISGLIGYQVTGWNNGCNPNTPGCSSTTLPAQITVN